MTLDLATRLADLALKFGRVNRATFHPDGKRPETDTDHTIMLILIGCTLGAELGLDVGKIAQLAAVHDLPETKCGDTPTFGIQELDRQKKKAVEDQAIASLFSEFRDNAWFVSTLTEYEQQVLPEARFVRYLDKVLPKLTHLFNKGITMRAVAKTRSDVIDIHEMQIELLAQQYPEFKSVDMLLRLACSASEAAFEEA